VISQPIISDSPGSQKRAGTTSLGEFDSEYHPYTVSTWLSSYLSITAIHPLDMCCNYVLNFRGFGRMRYSRMRFLNVNNLELEEFIGDSVPKYAILSHTWATEEVIFQDWASPATRERRKDTPRSLELACMLAAISFGTSGWTQTASISLVPPNFPKQSIQCMLSIQTQQFVTVTLSMSP
jgi:hypothetical protein